MTQEIKGWQFPDGIDVPEDPWYRTAKGRWTMGWQGFLDVAHQAGLEGVECTVEDSGVDQDGIPWVAVRASVRIDGARWEAIGSVDAPANSLEDMASTAQSKALARAIRVALNIRPVREQGGDDTPDIPEPPEVNEEPEPEPAPVPDADGEW